MAPLISLPLGCPSKTAATARGWPILGREANLFVTALREQMSPEHPIRRFLTPFTYQTIAPPLKWWFMVVHARGAFWSVVHGGSDQGPLGQSELEVS